MNRISLTFLALALALLVGGAGEARASLVITFAQDGSDVVASGAGSLNFLDLSYQTYSFNTPSVTASAGFVNIGPVPATSVDYYGNISGPTSFGSGGNFLATSGTSTAPNNTNAGVDGATDQLLLPGGYLVSTPFTVSSTWNNATLSGLGLAPGTYTWTWGSGVNADYLEVVIPGSAATPEPASMTLLASGIFAAGGFGLYRRRRAAATS